MPTYRGTRLPDEAFRRFEAAGRVRMCDYGLMSTPSGLELWACAPTGRVVRIPQHAGWRIEDGDGEPITVTAPLIVASWRGWLTRGVWADAPPGFAMRGAIDCIEPESDNRAPRRSGGWGSTARPAPRPVPAGE